MLYQPTNSATRRTIPQPARTRMAIFIALSSQSDKALKLYLHLPAKLLALTVIIGETDFVRDYLLRLRLWKTKPQQAKHVVTRVPVVPALYRFFHLSPNRLTWVVPTQ